MSHAASDLSKAKEWFQSGALVHPLSGKSIADVSKATIEMANSGEYRVLFVILDGLGSELFGRVLHPDSFLRKHYKQDVFSVFPATTAAALTSIATGQHPGEHGIIGWQQRLHQSPGEHVDAFILPWVRASDGAPLDELLRAEEAEKYFSLTSLFEKQ